MAPIQKAPMRRFTPRASSPAIDNYVAENPEKLRENGMLANVKLDALRRIIAMCV
jgi:hypothetical protein